MQGCAHSLSAPLRLGCLNLIRLIRVDGVYPPIRSGYAFNKTETKMTESNPSPPNQSQTALPWDVIIHSTTGITCLVIGAFMVITGAAWSTHTFSALMLLSFVSALIISATTHSWVRGHFLAMAPVIGIALGYLGFEWGFALAYALIWTAFLHFVWRGLLQK